MTRAERIREMAESHAAAWSRGDVAGTLALFAEDGEISVNGAPPHRGHAAIGATAEGLMASFPGLTVTCHETRVAGDRAVFVWTLEGTHAETGNAVTLPGWHEWALDADSRVVRCRGFFDQDDLARQIGGG